MGDRLVIAGASTIVLIVTVALIVSDAPRVMAWGIGGTLCVMLIVLGVHFQRRIK